MNGWIRKRKFQAATHVHGEQSQRSYKQIDVLMGACTNTCSMRMMNGNGYGEMQDSRDAIKARKTWTKYGIALEPREDDLQLYYYRCWSQTVRNLLYTRRVITELVGVTIHQIFSIFRNFEKMNFQTTLLRPSLAKTWPLLSNWCRFQNDLKLKLVNLKSSSTWTKTRDRQTSVIRPIAYRTNESQGPLLQYSSTRDPQNNHSPQGR